MIPPGRPVPLCAWAGTASIVAKIAAPTRMRAHRASVGLSTERRVTLVRLLRGMCNFLRKRALGARMNRHHRKLSLAGLSLVVMATPLAAHDFWLQPLRFQTAVNVPFPVTFQVGHGAARQRWEIGNRVLLLNDVVNGARRDIRGDLRQDGPADLITRFTSPGLHIIALQSTYAQSDLTALRFNDYAKAEGLAAVLAERARAGTTAKPGRERYSRRGKALIQVGQLTPRNQALVTRPIGLKLEIVPERNPYELVTSRMLPVRVMYNGRRLPNATVKLTSLEFDARPVAMAVTDRAGRATFRIPPVGDWLINVIWSAPVTGDPKADFDTTFSSLTFGYDPARRTR